MSGTPSIPPSLSADQYDGIFWGIFISTALFGITVVQGWIYLNTNQDRWLLRLLVALLLLMDTAHTILGGRILHYYFVENFGNSVAFSKVSVFVNGEFSITVGIVFIVQMYFVSRIYLLYQRKKWLSILIAISATGTFVAGVVTNHDQIKQQNQVAALFSRSIMIEAGIDHAMATLTDVMITVALSVKFSGAQVYFDRTRNVLQKVLLYIVTRGFLVTVVQMLFLIMYEAAPTNLIWAIFHYCLGKVYVITMISMWGIVCSGMGCADCFVPSHRLNSRITLRLELETPVEIGSLAFIDPKNTDTTFIEMTRSPQVVDLSVDMGLAEVSPATRDVGNNDKKPTSSFGGEAGDKA